MCVCVYVLLSPSTSSIRSLIACSLALYYYLHDYIYDRTTMHFHCCRSIVASYFLCVLELSALVFTSTLFFFLFLNLSRMWFYFRAHILAFCSFFPFPTSQPLVTRSYVKCNVKWPIHDMSMHLYVYRFFIFNLFRLLLLDPILSSYFLSMATFPVLPAYCYYYYYLYVYVTYICGPSSIYSLPLDVWFDAFHDYLYVSCFVVVACLHACLSFH